MFPLGQVLEVVLQMPHKNQKRAAMGSASEPARYAYGVRQSQLYRGQVPDLTQALEHHSQARVFPGEKVDRLLIPDSRAV